MERRVEGTYLTMKEVKEAIERLEEDNYATDEMMVITDKEQTYDDSQIASYTVNVDSVEVNEEEETFWDKIKETLSFDQYSSNGNDSLLTEFGVNEEQAEHFNEALETGEIILLVDSNAPKKIDELSAVNEEVVDQEVQPSEETVQMGHVGKVHSIKENNAYDKVNQADQKKETVPETKETAQLDEENFDASQAENTRKESEIISERKENSEMEKQNKKPTDVSTSETDDEAMKDEQIAASQAQNKRDDENKSEKKDSEEEGIEGEDPQGPSLEKNPDLTGEEATVDKDEKPHRYPDTVNDSIVNGKEKE